MQDHNPLKEAQRLDAWGFNVLPANLGKKSPAVEKWAIYQTQRTTELLPEWFNRPRNYWIVTGKISGIVVLDLDNDLAQEFWRSRFGNLLVQTATVRTGSGKPHYYFRIPPSIQSIRPWTHESIGFKCTSSCSKKEGQHDHPAFDVKGDGAGVIVPPSIHPDTGQPYEWIRNPDDGILEAPPGLWKAPNLAKLGRRAGVRAISSDERGATGVDGSTALALDPTSAPEHSPSGDARSLLAQLLRHPPQGPDSGRNNWLTQVAGHLTRMVPHEDAYAELIRALNRSLPDPLEPSEADKVLFSVKRAESRKVGTPTETNGWLVGDGERLYTQIKRDEEILLVPWSDFDLRTVGVVDDEEEGLSYVCDLHLPGGIRRVLLGKKVLGDDRALKLFLAGFGATWIDPMGSRKMSPTSRLLRYLKSQEPQGYKSLDELGWHDDIGFVVHEGVITADGLHPHTNAMPNPAKIGWAPYKYGFVQEEEARRVLREVLTFHDETVAAVFGAWWAATILKSQIMRRTALFPFMGLEAPSESGKTTGMFSLLLQLSGNAEGQGQFTAPALRDRISAHRNGIVWVDDIRDVEGVFDVLRQSTSEGSRTKKGGDRRSNEKVRLVAPVVLSGEVLGTINTEKALRDRSVRLEVPSPVGRRSLKGDYPQWDDIVALKNEWGGDLTKLAGTVVQMLLKHAYVVDELSTFRMGSGRAADKFAILMVGATALSLVTEDATLPQRVRTWIDRQERSDNENSLTLEILPRLLADFRLPRSAMGHQPTFVDREGVVWFNETRVSHVWMGMRNVNRRLGDIESIRSQRRQLGLEGPGRLVVVRDDRPKGGQVKIRYQKLSPEISHSVLERSGYTLRDENSGEQGGLL